MTKGLSVLGGGIALFAMYMAAGPYITIYQMRSAAEQRDGEALAEHIEFPSVRQSLKEQMNALVLGQITGGSGKKVDGAKVLGTALTVRLLEEAIDAWVTPSGIASLMTGEDPQGPEARSGQNIDDPQAKARSHSSMSYMSIDKFVVRYDDEDGREVKLVLRRRGLGWKMTEVIIPLESLAR